MSVSRGMVVPVKEGRMMKEVQKKKAVAVKSDLLGVFSSAVANSSAANFVPPPKKDKFGFLIKPKVARGPARNCQETGQRFAGGGKAAAQ